MRGGRRSRGQTTAQQVAPRVERAAARVHEQPPPASGPAPSALDTRPLPRPSPAAVMRAIDMLALLLAPLAVGFMMTYAGMLPSVAAIWCYSALAWAPECLLLRAATQLAPQLR